MKKNLIALAVLAAASSAAMAQSSVTLFGIADATVKYGQGSGGNKTQVGSGGNATSRLGFRGIEDLGGGLQAGFWLEAGYTIDTGAGQNTSTNNQTTGATGGGGLAFNRRSTVSLLGGFGEVRLGRDLAVTYRNVGDFDPFGDVGAGNTLMDSGISLSSITTAVRVSNSVNYFLPTTLAGVYGQAQYYLGENATDTVVGGVTTVGKKDGTGGGLRLGYAQGPVNVAISYGATKFVAGDQNTVNLGGTYDLGVAKIWGIYNQDKVKSTAASVEKTGQSYLVGLTAPVGLGEIRASYANYKRKESLATGDKSTGKFSLGYVYNLSKRTAVYTTVAFLRNKNLAGQSVNSAVLNNANDNSNGFDVGIRHSF